MTLPSAKLVSRRFYVRLALLALGALALCASSASAQTTEKAKPATTTTVTPYALFQDGGLTSATNTVDATRVPAVDSSGNLHYWDVSLIFDTDSSGDVTLAPGYPKITLSANPLSSNFKAGTYVVASGIDGGKDIIVVSGPSVLSGGATAWTLAGGPGSSSLTTPTTAVWYMEPTIASSPLASRITKAGIANSQLSYGVSGAGGYWCTDSLLGFSQVGNSLTISDYSSCGDHSTPVDQRTYTLQQ